MEYLAGGPQNIPMLFDGGLQIDDIPAGFYSEKDGIKLMTPGKIQQANEACAYAFSVIVAQFMSVLTMQENEVMMLDMEAGTEHFGRGTDNMLDAILMVVDTSFESLRLSATKQMAWASWILKPEGCAIMCGSFWMVSTERKEMSVPQAERLLWKL